MEHRVLTVDELVPGMEVAVAKDVHYGADIPGRRRGMVTTWDILTVSRVTLRKTKIVLDNGMEIKVWGKRPETTLYAPDESLRKEAEDTGVFLDIHGLLVSLTDGKTKERLKELDSTGLLAVRSWLRTALGVINGENRTCMEDI